MPWMWWVYAGILLATGDLSQEMCPSWSSTRGVATISTTFNTTINTNDPYLKESKGKGEFILEPDIRGNG